MASPAHDEAIRAFINLVSHTGKLTPDLPRSVFPVMVLADVERISLGEATMIPILCSLFSTVTELKTQVSTLESALTALDAHTRSLPSAATIQGVVSESATAPISASIRDLSHRVAGIPTVQASSSASLPNRPPNMTTQIAQPQPPHPSRQNKPSSAQTPQQMDPDIPRFDPASKTFYGNPQAYATKFSNSWEAEAYRAGKYPPLSSFTPGDQDPLVAAPTPNQHVAMGSYVSAPAGKAGPGKKGKKKSPASGAHQVAALTKPPFGELKRKTLPGVERPFFAPRSTPAPHPRPNDISATFPDIMAALLKDNNSDLPCGFTVKVNSRGAVTVIVTDTETPAAAYSPFFDAITARLNQSFPVGESP